MVNAMSSTAGAPVSDEREYVRQGRLRDLWTAVQVDDVDKVKDILDSYPTEAHPRIFDIREDKTRFTLLHVAAISNSKKVSQFLLSQKGMDFWASDRTGRSPLSLAYCTRDEELIKIFELRCLPRHMVTPTLVSVPKVERP